MKALATAGLALVAGALWGLCFGREPLGLAPWAALVPLFFLLNGERPGRWGFLHGLAAWLVSIPWIAPTLETYGGLNRPLAALLLVVLCSYLACYHLVFALLGSRLWRRGGAVALAGLPALWVALEWLRTHLITGFPWNLAAYAAVEGPGVLTVSAWIGPYGSSFLLLLVNGALAMALAGRRWAVSGWVVGLVFLALIASARWTEAEAPDEQRRGVFVHVIQPNITSSSEPTSYRRDYHKVHELSRRACERRQGVLVWPESAAWPYSYDDAPFLRRDLAALAAAGCPVVLNSPTRTGERPFNSALVVQESGVAGRYHKRHLVPFGEYVPAAVRWLPFVGKVARNAADFAAGDEETLLPVDGERLGMSICFEVTFPGEVAQLVRGGATVLTTITNDSWYGDSSAPWQHFRAARFRAAENRRPMVRAAITGVSGIIGPQGDVLSRLEVFKRGVLSTQVVGRSGVTLYSRLPWLVPLLSSVAAAFAIFRSARPRQRAGHGVDR